MLTNILLILIAVVVLFELFEHVLFPLAWSFAMRKRRSPCGTEGMPGKVVEVKHWRDGSGQVLVEGEYWTATSDDLMKAGDSAVIREVDGLVLKVVLLEKPTAVSHRQSPV